MSKPNIDDIVVVEDSKGRMFVGLVVEILTRESRNSERVSIEVKDRHGESFLTDTEHVWSKHAFLGYGNVAESRKWFNREAGLLVPAEQTPAEADEGPIAVEPTPPTIATRDPGDDIPL